VTSVERERESQFSRLARRGFSDPSAAAALLATELFGELGRDPLLIDALGRSADPDLALDSLARLIEASSDASLLRATLAASKPLRDRLLGVLGISVALGDFLVRHPADWHVLEEFDVKDLAHGPDRFTGELLAAVGAEPGQGGGRPVAGLTGPPAADALRHAYYRALLALTARDVTAGTELPTVAADLADLAAATLEAALAVARAEEPPGAEPVRLAVIGMGKCGARELNYVSDVDVVFIAEAVAQDDGPGNEEAALRSATRLASRLMRLCSESTAEGSIWQVDAALRPEGKSGPLVRSLASHAAYYQRWAKTWEFQALLKARPIAGDLALGEAFCAIVEPLVWSAASREHFVDDVQAMRRRVIDNTIASLRRAPGAVSVDRELKLGPGGLRDVEFAVQLLQLVHGRADESLRTRSTLDSLDALAQGGYVGRQDATHLSDAYCFLRTVEHRIQLFRLERTHTMPEDPAALRRIGRSMGWTVDPAAQLRTAWKGHALEVRRLHEKLFYRPLLSAVARLDGEGVDLSGGVVVPSGVDPHRRLSVTAARSRLAALGYTDPAGALVNIEALATGLSRRAAIQRTLLPVLLDWFADAPDPDAGLLAFRRVSDALGATPWYLRSLRDEGESAARLAHVLSSGGYLADLLLRAPESVALLSDDRALHVRDRATIEAEMLALVHRAESAEQAVAAVRAVRRRELFRIGAADILGLLGSGGAAGSEAIEATEAIENVDAIDVLGQALTDVTAATIAAALAAVTKWRDGSRVPTDAARLAVIAMGRFGGAELGYGSDADVLFVYEAGEDAADERAANAVAYELANELRRLLQMPSADPPLVIDADLRPEGRQGPLVRSLASYAEYYRRWSKVWESQALLRAMPIAGDAGVGARFAALIEPLRYPPAGLPEADAREIRRIKARMEAERLPRGADRSLHTKLGPGGLSDVEWVAQLLQLRFGGEQVVALRTTATRTALRAARQAGLLDEADRALLDDAWCQTSRLRNAITIVRGRPDDLVPTGGRELAGVARYLSGSRPHADTVGAHGEPPDREALLDAHRRRARRARMVFERLFFEEG
jgi:[glutamine synthetase] adenylyltransferase / [glutamine synthetase]-adenylyl-L-tyrosine phosphorylase